jgi:hypothetical protein
MQSLLQVQWLVRPLATPRPWLSCARCGIRRPFVCSEKFRVNAQKKRIDAWLIYRCAHCDQIWNFPVLERCLVSGIAPAMLRALAENDAGLARRHAFDLARLGRHSSAIEGLPGLHVEKRLLSACEGSPALAEITITAPLPIELRLDRFLAEQLGISRSSIGRLAERKALVVLPAVKPALRRVVRDGQRIRISFGAIVPGPDLLGKIVGAGKAGALP